MKTISIRLEDSIYEELGKMLDEMGQTKQTFYETFTKTALREVFHLLSKLLYRIKIAIIEEK